MLAGHSIVQFSKNMKEQNLKVQLSFRICHSGLVEFTTVNELVFTVHDRMLTMVQSYFCSGLSPVKK